MIHYSRYHALLLSNVTSIQDAQIIFLSEKHQKKGHQSKNALLINDLYRPGDLVLVEHDKTLPISRHFGQIHLIPKKIEAKGWDLPINTHTKTTWDLTQEAHQIIQEGFVSPSWELFIQKLKDYIKEQTSLLTPVDLERYCQVVITDKEYANKSAVEKREIIHKIKRGFSQDAINLLYSLKIKNCDLAMRKEITKCLLDYVCKIFIMISFRDIDKLAIQRNQSLIQTIEENLHIPNRRIFVISGLGHLDYLKNATDKQITSVKLLRDFLKDKKFVMLTPQGIKIAPWMLKAKLAIAGFKERIKDVTSCFLNANIGLCR